MWFILSIVALLLFSIAAVVDKFMLSKAKLPPIAYAFYVSVLGGLISSFFLLFGPDFYFPQSQLITLLIAGGTFYFALLSMFQAVVKSEVSKVNPLIISLTPLLVYLFSFLLGVEFLTYLKLLGILLIIAGSYGLSQAGLPKTRLKPKVWLFIILAGTLFALANTFSKLAYNHLSFINAFIWLRWATLAAALLFTCLAGGWSKIFNFKEKKSEKKEKWSAFAIGQTAGGLGVILMQYAIKLGSVTLVTALQGFQFFFVIIIVYLLSKFSPKVLEENIQTKFVALKVVWSLLMFLGVVLILV